MLARYISCGEFGRVEYTGRYTLEISLSKIAGDGAKRTSRGITTGCSIFLAEMNSCPRYAIIKIKKILFGRFFKIFIIVFSRIRHALCSGVSLHRPQVKIKTAHFGRFKILISWWSMILSLYPTYKFQFYGEFLCCMLRFCKTAHSIICQS